MKTNRIQGLTVMECMTDLDPALVAEAELDACFLPPLTAYQKKEHKKARREAARERREENPFFRFAGSGAGAVCISLVVAFALIAGIVYFINYGPKNPVAPGPGGQPEGTQAPAWGEGQIPTGEIDAAYTISTEQRMYETSPKRIAVTMRAKNPGVDIDYFHAFRIESLTDPAGELDFDCLWTEEWMERAEPVGKDEYAAWTKSVSINGVMPDGIYRIHHMEYDKDKGYVSAAFCDFAVGKSYGELLLQDMPEFTTRADQDVALLDAFFAADESALFGEALQFGVTRRTLWHITPTGLYEATGVRIFKDAEQYVSYLLLDGKLYSAGTYIKGYGLHTAVVCDYDRNGVDDILYTSSGGYPLRTSSVWVFNTETKESHKIFDTEIFQYADSTFSGTGGNKLVELDLCVKASGGDSAPTFTLYQTTAKPGKHGFADMTFSATRYFATVELTAGELPQIHVTTQPGEEEQPPVESTPAGMADIAVSKVQDSAMLDAFFAADRSGLSNTDITRENLWYVPHPSCEEIGVRLYDYVDGGRSTSFLLTDGVVFDLGMRLVNAIVCDCDLDKNLDILFTGTAGSGIQYSLVAAFSLKSMTVQRIYTAILPDAPKYLVVCAVSEQMTGGVPTGVYALYQSDYRVDEEREFCGTYENLRLLAELELRKGKVPVLHFADMEPEYSVSGDASAVPPVIEAPPLPSEAPHVLHNVSWHADETTGYLTLTYRAREKGETLSLREDELWFDFARLDTTERHRGVCFSSPELKNVTIEPDAATDGYAEYSITHTFLNPETLPVGTYRVYAVNGMLQILDTLDVTYDGETMTVIPDDPTPGFTSDILLESVTLTREDLTIYYTTPEKGQTMYYPSWSFRVEKIGGEANPAKIDFDSPELSIDYIDPTEEKNGYAVLGMRHYISLSDHDALLPGTYRIMALTWEGEVFDFIDVSFDGETSTVITADNSST